MRCALPRFNPSTSKIVQILFTAVLAAMFFGVVGSVEAAVVTWTGGGGASHNWSTGGNWDSSPFAPQNNDSLVFPAGAPNNQNTNNFSGRTFASITFAGAGGSYFIYGNAITLTGGINQSSTGGANTFHPDITLATNNQTFTVSGAGAGSGLTLSGDLDLNGRTLTVNVTDSGTELIMSGTVSGTGNITRNTGAGGLRFSGSAANTYTGNTTINSGYIFAVKNNNIVSLPGDVFIGNGSGVDTLLMGADNQFGATSDVTIRDGGLFDINNETNTIAALNFIDGGTVDMTTGRLQLGGTVTVSGSGVSNCIINGNLHLGTATRTFNIADTAQASDLVIDAVISGGSSGFFPAGIIKTGAGLLRFNAANTYGGSTTVNDGQLTVANDKGLGGTFSLFGSASTVVNSNAVLLLNDAHITNEVLTLNSTNPNGALQNNATADWAGDIVLNASTFIEASSTFGIDGLISGTGGFTKVGGSTLTLRGTNVNSYAGDTIVNNGTLELNVNANNGAIPGDLTINGAYTVRLLRGDQFFNGSIITINTGGVLDANGFGDIIGGLVMTGGTAQSGAGRWRLNGNLTVNASSTVSTITGELELFGSSLRTFNLSGGAANPDLDISAIISGNGGITVNNSLVEFSRVNFSGANTYAGLTTFNNSGTVDLVHASALGSTAAGTVLNGPNMVVHDVIVGEGLTNNGSSTLQGTTATGWTGPIVLNANLNLQVTSAAYTLDLSGVISGTGAITKQGANGGTVIFSGASGNTYTNTTTVTAGTLLLNKSSVNSAILGELTIGDGVGGVNADVVRLGADNQIANTALIHMTSSGLFDLNSNLELTGAVDGSGQIDLGVGGNFEPGGGNGTSTYTGLIVGSGSIFKLGNGTWTLTGNNTYTGTTTVSAGTLVVNGSQQQTPVIVNGSATLGGTGSIGNLFVFGSLTPGTSPGILTCSNFACSSVASDYFVELTGPIPGTDYDQLNVRGTNALASATLHVTAAFTTPVGVGQPFNILNNDGAEAITGTFNGLAEGATITVGGYKFTISYASGNNVVLTLTNVPSTAVTTTVTSGNGNHFIDPNECNNLSLVISNQSGALMSGITGTLSTKTPGVIITQPYSDYPNIAVNGKGTNATPFQISTLPSFVCGTDIELELIVNSSAGLFIVDSVLKTGSGLPSASPLRFDVAGPVAIPDPGILNSVANVTGFTGPLTKVGVALWLTHPVDGDLNIGLISPDGVMVDLSSGNGGSGDDYGVACSPDAARTTFDDGAGLTIGALGTAPPFVGTFKPESPLGAVLGGTINGNWTLRINDTVAGGAGSLRCWSLFLYPMQCSAGGGACDNCLPAITGSITNTDLLMTDRIGRNEVVAGCGTPKAWPGTAGAGGGTNFNYDSYAFTNTWDFDACVTVLLSGCNVQAGVYLNTFNPLNVVTNYLGDSGDSTGTDAVGGFGGGPQSCSVTVPAGARFVVTVNEIIQNSGCSGYTLRLSGLPCPPPVLAINSVSNQTVRVHWPTSAGGYKLEATASLAPTNWAFVTNEPIVVGGRFSVTNTPPPTNRFYRLQKP